VPGFPVIKRDKEKKILKKIDPPRKKVAGVQRIFYIRRVEHGLVRVFLHKGLGGKKKEIGIETRVWRGKGFKQIRNQVSRATRPRKWETGGYPGGRDSITENKNAVESSAHEKKRGGHDPVRSKVSQKTSVHEKKRPTEDVF